MDFGQRLARLRKTINLTQIELAEKLGLSRQQLANYEQGKRKPNLEILTSIADFFGVTLDYLICREPNDDSKEREESFRETEILSCFDFEVTFNGKYLTPKEKDKAVKILKALLED